MKCCFEWNAQQDIAVTPGNYFESTVLAGDNLYPEATGRDEFQFAGLIKPGKRLAGSGRSKCYSREEMDTGSGVIEAAPSAWVEFKGDPSKLLFRISTDIILDPGCLAACLSLDIATEGGTAIHIPLNLPDIQIDWQSRGTFIVRVDKI
ncbi:MAG: hypothetical protein K0R22_1000 [Sporomusa sp.]|nr:hypothetical protein [Sporomusa sp.]